MIRELLGESYTAYRGLVGTGLVVTLYLASIFVVWFVMRKKSRITPVLLSVIGSIAVSIAHVLELVWASFKEKKRRYVFVTFAALLFILAICISGTNIFLRGQSVKAENNMHLPQYIIEAADEISQKDPGARVLTMPGWGRYFGAYTSRIETISPEAGDESSADEDKRILLTELSKIHPDMKKVAAIAHGSGCAYVALSDGTWQDIPITDLGYELVLETKGCRLYREVSAP